MSQFNFIAVEGRLTKNPEFSYTVNNKPLLKFSLANNRTSSSKNGKLEEVSFFDVMVFGASAELFNKYLKKGSHIIVSGRIEQRRWEKEGKKYSKIFIYADKIDFVYSAPKSDKFTKSKKSTVSSY